MGQIVIDIPDQTTRRYNLEESDQAQTLVKFLDQLLKSGDSAHLSHQQFEDLKDGMESDLAMEEWRRTGESYSVEEIRKELGIS